MNANRCKFIVCVYVRRVYVYNANTESVVCTCLFRFPFSFNSNNGDRNNNNKKTITYFGVWAVEYQRLPVMSQNIIRRNNKTIDRYKRWVYAVIEITNNSSTKTRAAAKKKRAFSKQRQPNTQWRTSVKQWSKFEFKLTTVCMRMSDGVSGAQGIDRKAEMEGWIK